MRTSYNISESPVGKPHAEPNVGKPIFWMHCLFKLYYSLEFLPTSAPCWKWELERGAEEGLSGVRWLAPGSGSGLAPLVLAPSASPQDHRGLASSLPLAENWCSRTVAFKAVQEGLCRDTHQITKAQVLPERGCVCQGCTGQREQAPFPPGPVSFQMSPKRPGLQGGAVVICCSMPALT